MKRLLLILLCFPHFIFGQQTINDSIIHDNLYRNYITYIPAIYNASQPTPLVFNFHGLTGNSAIAMWHADFRSIADTANFIIVHPQGLLNSSGETHWNVGQIGTSINDIDFISSLLDSLSLEYNIDSDRVYSTGMSNGAYMSYRLACELSDKIAAIAPVAGSYISYKLNSCNPSHATPVLHIHGVADSNTVYYGKPGVESIPSIISYWVNYNQCDTQSVFTQIANSNLMDSSIVEHYNWKNGVNGVGVEHFKIIDGGHTWPGSNFPNIGDGGITNYDINASLEIWKFFSKYDINGLINPTAIINEHNLNNQLIQVIDIFGRESKGLKNQPLFYIYDDGTVEKKIIIE
jgi:polyhydroxybutyrate depolymerase